MFITGSTAALERPWTLLDALASEASAQRSRMVVLAG